MISIYGAEYAKAVSSQSGWIDYAIQNTPGTNPEMNNVSGFNLDPAGFFLVGDPNPQSYGGLSVLWTSEYELDSICWVLLCFGDSSIPYLSCFSGDQFQINIFFCEICSKRG